jgi:hypothetical protein
MTNCCDNAWLTPMSNSETAFHQKLVSWQLKVIENRVPEHDASGAQLPHCREILSATHDGSELVEHFYCLDGSSASESPSCS